jgi:hypothetical protein
MPQTNEELEARIATLETKMQRAFRILKRFKDWAKTKVATDQKDISDS